MSAGQTPDNPDGRDTQDASIPWAALWDWLGGRLAVVGRGLLLFWLALAGFVLLVALAAVLAGPPALVVRPSATPAHVSYGRNLALVVASLGIVAWLVVAPLVLLGMRSLARLTRRLAGRWCAVPIADPYLPPPWADGGKRGPRRRLRLAAHRPGDLAGPAVGDRGRMRGLDPGRPARRAAGARRARRDRALRLVAGPRAGHRRRGLRAVGGPVG